MAEKGLAAAAVAGEGTLPAIAGMKCACSTCAVHEGAASAAVVAAAAVLPAAVQQAGIVTDRSGANVELLVLDVPGRTNDLCQWQSLQRSSSGDMDSCGSLVTMCCIRYHLPSLSSAPSQPKCDDLRVPAGTAGFAKLMAPGMQG